MKVLDLNILLYAVNRDSPQHVAAKAWLEGTLSSDESVSIPWVVVLGFLRVATSARILPRSLPPDDALAVTDSWLARPNVIALAPGPLHWDILRGLISKTGAAGNLTTDAHIAALAIEYEGELCSTDSDFARFTALRWTNPLA